MGLADDSAAKSGKRARTLGRAGLGRALKAIGGLAKGIAAILGVSSLWVFVGFVVVLFPLLIVFGDMPEEVNKTERSKYEPIAKAYTPKIESYDEAEKEHELPWGLLYAIDFFLNQNEKGEVDFSAKGIAPRLKPTFEYTSGEVIIEREVVGSDGKVSSRVEKKSVKLVKRAITYRGIYEYEYKMITSETPEGKVTRPIRDKVSFREDLGRLKAACLAVNPDAVNENWNETAIMLIRAGEAFTAGAPSLEWLADEQEIWSQAASKWNWTSRYQGHGLDSPNDRQWPLEGAITSPFGRRIHPLFGTVSFHTGVDIGAPWGAPIRSAGAGLVVAAGYVKGYGLTVVIDHGQDEMTLYGHCSELLVKEGDEVMAGQVIAREGSTGFSTGPHLHFEVRIKGEAVDPLKYFAK
ncbi:MAG: M23 family metallopeptidase [Candidatus Hadarchaeum sp.]